MHTWMRTATTTSSSSSADRRQSQRRQQAASCVDLKPCKVAKVMTSPSSARWKLRGRGSEGREAATVPRAGEASRSTPTTARLRSDERHQADRLQAESARTWTSCGLGCAITSPTSAPSALMSTKVNCDDRAASSCASPRSGPVVPLDISITPCAVANGGAVMTSGEGEDAHTTGKTTEMGRKAIVPYGLYRAHGFYNPHLARQTGFQSENLGCSGRKSAAPSVGPGPLGCTPTDGLPQHLCFLTTSLPATPAIVFSTFRSSGVKASYAPSATILVTADEAKVCPGGHRSLRLGVWAHAGLSTQRIGR